MEWKEDDFADYDLTEEIVDLSDGDNEFALPCEEAVNKDDDHRNPQKGYTVLKESDIRKRLEADIIHVSTVLSISRVESSLLLRYYQWNVSRLHDEWFSDEGKVRTTVGLLNFAPVEKIVTFSRKKKSRVCGICLELNSLSSMLSAGCDHQFCVDCWRGYVTTAICDGPNCLMLRCPEPSCNSAIGEDMIDKVASDEDKEKYYQFMVRSYVEDKRNVKWCPAPDCEFAVEFDDLWTSVKDVTCLCSNTFCWNCLEEVHRPVECTTVAKWTLKNSAESGNMTWIIAYTKPCPKCKRPIQKNNGCNHMTCGAPCKFEFCWLCLGPWGNHVSCNTYNVKKQDDEESDRKKARLYLERYTHYFERWNGNQKSRLKALEDLQQMEDINLEKLSNKYSQSSAQLTFITDAWKQIVECRRVLKWTYAYGYYLPEEENTKRDLFEYLQGEAELGLERLHSCAEKDLKVFLNGRDDDDGDGEFVNFRCKLVGLTVTTRNYFENLVSALENGLSDVECKAGCSSRTKIGGVGPNRPKAVWAREAHWSD